MVPSGTHGIRWYPWYPVVPMIPGGRFPFFQPIQRNRRASVHWSQFASRTARWRCIVLGPFKLTGPLRAGHPRQGPMSIDDAKIKLY